MNLEQRLRENILRFGTKNLNENLKTKILLETDPDPDFDPNEIPDEVSPNYDPDVESDELTRGQQIKQKAKQVGKVAKDVLITASLVGLLAKVMRNRLYKRYIRKNGIPSKEELIAKDSDRVKSHPAYQQTIDLMYRDRRTMKAASRYNVWGEKQQKGLPILYWYGTPALGGEENPEDKSAMEGMLMRGTIRKTILANQIRALSDDATAEAYFSGVTEFLNGLKELYDGGIFITATDLLDATNQDKYLPIYQFLSYLFYGADPNIEKEFEEIYSPLTVATNMSVIKKLKNLNAAIKLGVADSGVTPKGKQLRDLDISSTTTMQLSDDDKLGILSFFQRESDSIGKPIIDATYWDIESSGIGIKTNKALETTTIKGEKGAVTVTYQYFTLPADPNGPDARNAFFGNNDDKTVVDQDGITKMNSLLNGLIAEAKQQGQRVVSVQYCAGAKTSAVGTKFGMTSKQKATATSDTKTQANVGLANERCKSIIKAINETVLPTVKQQPDMGDDKVTYGVVPASVGGANGVFAYPNCGPSWYWWDPVGENNKFKGRGYGPIFNNLYNLLKTNKPKVNGQDVFDVYGIPQMFYVCRNTPKAYQTMVGYLNALKNADETKYGNIQIPTQQQIEAEYESVFAPFRGTYAGFLIGTVVETTPSVKPEKETNLEAEIEKFGEFEAMIDWTTRLQYTKDSVKAWGKRKWNKFSKWVKSFKIDLDLDGGGGGGGGAGHSVAELCDAFTA
jgi:hypothetical protein